MLKLNYAARYFQVIEKATFDFQCYAEEQKHVRTAEQKLTQHIEICIFIHGNSSTGSFFLDFLLVMK